eukprot:4258831-Alexandrium_andersonii.AAC.1
MSASLVGSEMCIRDRARPPSDEPQKKHPKEPSRTAPGRARERKPNLRAVSYTHLTLPTICSV